MCGDINGRWSHAQVAGSFVHGAAGAEVSVGQSRLLGPLQLTAHACIVTVMVTMVVMMMVMVMMVVMVVMMVMMMVMVKGSRVCSLISQ